MNWKYTNIQHAARIQLGISPNEYCVADVIYKSQTHPDFGKNGWTKIGCHKLAEFFGYSVGAVHKMLQRFEESGLLEFDGNKEAKRMTAKFYDIAYLDDADVQKVNAQKEGVQKVNTHVQKVNRDRSLSEHNNISKEELVINTHTKSEKSETEFEPATKNASGAESRYLLAMDKITAHLKNYPDTLELIRGEARRNYDNRELMEQIQDWVRYYCDDVMFSPNAEHRLRYGNKSFVWWLKQRPDATKKPVNNGTNRNTETAADRERKRAAGAFAVRDQILREHGIDPSNYGVDY